MHSNETPSESPQDIVPLSNDGNDDTFVLVDENGIYAPPSETTEIPEASKSKEIVDQTSPPKDDFFRPIPDDIAEKHPVSMSRAQYNEFSNNPHRIKPKRTKHHDAMFYTDDDARILEEVLALEAEIKKLPVLSIDTKPIPKVRAAVAQATAEAKLSSPTQTGAIKKVVGKIVTKALAKTGAR